jgi:hypothetical protein
MVASAAADALVIALVTAPGPTVAPATTTTLAFTQCLPVWASLIDLDYFICRNC